MQLVTLATLIGTVGAFNMRASSRTGARSLQMNDGERSIALPFDKRPDALDGTLAGDAGFDPAGFTNNLPFEGLIGGETRSLKWYREAEVVHGRVAQLAVVGQLFPS
jgi:light-harvesting complex I chlorophyll a/b binding protein 1